MLVLSAGASGQDRTIRFQKPAGGPGQGSDSPSKPLPAQGLPEGQADPKRGQESGKAATGPGAPEGARFEGAVNRSTAFRLEGDAALNRRIVDELVRDTNRRNVQNAEPDKEPVVRKAADYRFPESQPVAPKGTTYVAKTVSYPPNGLLIDPTYVTHRRLYFEEPNAERFGWDLGPLQTVVSAGAFYKDVFFLPARFASHPHERYDTSAGRCRPGDPVPYYVYPPEIDIWGYAAQASTLVGAAFVFPY